MIGVAPGPANGFTLDLIGCLERFGDLIDWAMIILNPLEPWPGELCLAAAATAGVKVITRVVDYGGLFFDDSCPGQELTRTITAASVPPAGSRPARERIEGMRPIAERHDLTLIQLACQWNLAHEAVQCVVPTLIQEAGPAPARRGQARRAGRAAAELRLTPGDVERSATRRQHRLHGAEGRRRR
jgi:hypothetical protein